MVLPLPNPNLDTRITTMVDGMISLLSKVLCAHVNLIADADAGDTVISVENTLRFETFDKIVIADTNSGKSGPDGRVLTNVEYHTVLNKVSTNQLVLTTPLKRSFRVSDKALIRKVHNNAILYPGDILYGDREVIPNDVIAVCVEPERMTPEWIGIPGLASHDFRMSVLAYVKGPQAGGKGDKNEEWALRTCHSIADSIHRILMGNIHIDLDVDEVRLVRDVYPGDNFVYIDRDVADYWPPDGMFTYEIQDNTGLVYDWIGILSPVSSSSSESSFPPLSSFIESSSSFSTIMSSYSTLSSQSSESSSFSTGSSVSSVSSDAFLSSSTRSSSSFSTESPSESSESSESSEGGYPYRVLLGNTILRPFRVDDHAVLRRKRRYFYDSRASDIEYGVAQKGSALVKSAKIQWFGKESKVWKMPQPGKGGKAY